MIRLATVDGASARHSMPSGDLTFGDTALHPGWRDKITGRRAG
jgi:hypothetical protein